MRRGYPLLVAKRAEHLDPVVVQIDDEGPTMSFDEWLAVVADDAPVELGITAAELLAEAREAGEI